MKRGFTLIELLIVIGILAILATVAVLVLNPAEILRQARDTQRISDLSSIKSAIAMHLSTGTTPSTAMGSSTVNCTMTYASNTSFGGTSCVNGVIRVSTSSAVTGTGWVNVNFTDTSGGSAIGSLPLDPINNASYFYGYIGQPANNTFKLNAFLESTKYSPLMGSDGGPSSTMYETGTNLSL